MWWQGHDKSSVRKTAMQLLAQRVRNIASEKGVTTSNIDEILTRSQRYGNDRSGSVTFRFQDDTREVATLLVLVLQPGWPIRLDTRAIHEGPAFDAVVNYAIPLSGDVTIISLPSLPALLQRLLAATQIMSPVALGWTFYAGKPRVSVLVANQNDYNRIRRDQQYILDFHGSSICVRFLDTPVFHNPILMCLKVDLERFIKIRRTRDWCVFFVFNGRFDQGLYMHRDDDARLVVQHYTEMGARIYSVNEVARRVFPQMVNVVAEEKRHYLGRDRRL